MSFPVSSLLRATGLLLLVGFVASLAHPQAEEKPARPQVPAFEPKKIDLHKIANEELLRQAQTILDRANAGYLAQVREVTTVEIAFNKARKEVDSFTIPPRPPEPGKDRGDNLEQARLAREQARSQLEAFKKRLELVQTEKTLAEQLTGSVDACDSAALAFANLLEDFNIFIVEVDLRVKDRTLTADAVPKSLEPDALAQRRRDLATAQEQWKQKVLAARKELETTNQRAELFGKEVIEAKARFTQASNKYTREQKQKEVEKEYLGRPVDDLIQEGNRLREEEIGLIGSFNLAMSRFRTREAEVTQARQTLLALKAPDVQMGPMTRGQDAATAVATAQTLEQFHASQVKAIEALREALNELLEQGNLVEGESSVLIEHLFKVQVVVATLEQTTRKDPPKNPVPAHLTAEPVATQMRKLNESVSMALAVLEKSRQELAELEPREKAARTAQEEAGKRVADLKQTLEANQRVVQFEKELRKKNAAEAIAEFNRVHQLLQQKQPELDRQAETFKKAQEAVDTLRKKRETLKDPFVRIAEVESQAEKQKLLDELKKHAGLDRAPRDGSTMGTMMSMPVEGPGMNSPEPKAGKAKDGSAPGKEKGKEPGKADPGSVVGFQQVLATRVRVAEEQQEKDQELRKALQEELQVAERRAAVLGEVRELALQRYAVAVDLKKRLGRGEVKGEDIPDGILLALKPEDLRRLGSQATSLVGIQAQIRQDLEQLDRTDPACEALNRNLKEMLVLISQRLDLLEDLKRLEVGIRRDRKEYTEAEVKHLEQAAQDRLARENSWLEMLLSIDTSAQAKNLVEVLQTYYREAISLEEKQELLAQAREKGDKLVDLGEKETLLLQQAQKLMQDYLAEVERQREEEMLLARARLKSEEADELLRAYQVKTGKQLPRPVPVTQKDRARVVQQANEVLYQRFLEVEAARRWDQLLEARLSPLGLAAELGTYQDQLGTLAAAYGTNLRRILVLGGKVETPPAFPVSEDVLIPPATSEIATTRLDLYEVRRDGVLWIVGQILLVILFALFMPRFLALLVERATARTGLNGSQAHTHLVIAFMQAFLKLIVYTISLVMILSILGFDITAILAGLGIGGLAIGLAAQNALSDILGGLIIFMERPFSIGDTIRIGDSEAGQVVGLTWRITRLHDPDGVAINIPNRQVTEASIINLTREGGKTYDTVPILVPAVYPVEQVVGWIEEALDICKIPVEGAERGVDVEELSVSIYGTYYVRYMPFYYIKSLAVRDAARGEVIGVVTNQLRQQGVELAPKWREGGIG